MKKIFIVLALILAVNVANAQVKSPSAAKAAVAKAEAASANVKKAAKPATWMNLAKAYIDAYNAPTGNFLIGTDRNQLALMGITEKPVSSDLEPVEISGATYFKETYADKNIYYSQNNQLSMIEITRPVIENALDKAVDAYLKAAAVDTKGKSGKKIAAGLEELHNKYVEDAYQAYTLNNFEKSSEIFEKAAAAYDNPVLAKIDSNSIYNAAFTAAYVGKEAKAIELFEQCYKIGYFYEDGAVFSRLSDLYQKAGESEKSLAMLKEGFAAYPASQGILIGLINYYMSNGENPDEVFTLLDQAIANEPNNASLYNAKGDALKKVGRIDEAIAEFNKCNEIDKNFVYGFLGIAQIHCEEADAIAEKAQTEFNNKKYMELCDQHDAAMLSAIDYYEKAYAITDNEELKMGIANVLKTLYYRFVENEDPKYKAAYDKYSEIVKGGN